MKLFSRKALAAVATTAALTVSGMTAPAFAEDVVPPTTENQQPQDVGDENAKEEEKTEEEKKKEEETKTDESSSFGSSSNENGEGSSEDVEAKEIREWIGVFTAIIGALSTVFVFAQRIM